jgi:hypothetical protein
MKKVCIVQGGPFLLGVDNDQVIARHLWAETAVQPGKGRNIFQMNALLSRQAVETVPEDAVCLELGYGQDSVLLVADRITAEEVDTIEPLSSLPKSCPSLTAQLCPQVLIWDDKPVLLLDPTQILAVASKLGENIGRIPQISTGCSEITPLTEIPAEPEPEEDDPFFPIEEKTASKEKQDTDPPKEVPLFFMDETVAEAAEEPRGDEPANTVSQEAEKKESSPIDEETFKKVMSWVIARFKKSNAGEELHLGIEDLSPELARLVKRKGLDKKVVEYLIEQILFRCKTTIQRKKRREKNDAR